MLAFLMKCLLAYYLFWIIKSALRFWFGAKLKEKMNYKSYHQQSKNRPSAERDVIEAEFKVLD
jgi:hypothetical protein